MSSKLVERSNRAGERGYVMATTALMLIPMLIFAAFAVDVGSWYVEGQKIQRAADAAALAGVVWVPDTAAARAAAIEIAAVNGYEDQPGDFDDPDADLPQVKVSIVGSRQLRVDIRAEGDLYFGAVIEGFQEPQIHRHASSEYILPVEFGSPTNRIGYGPDTNAWTGMMGYCQPAHYGDIRAAFYQHQGGCTGSRSYPEPAGSAKPSFITNASTAADLNVNHDPEGYFFVVDIPPGRTGTGVDVRIYDGGLCGQNPSTPKKPGPDNNGTHLEYILHDATDTPLDDSDTVEVARWSPADGGVQGCWDWIVPPGFDIPVGVSGRYYLQIVNDEDEWGGFGGGVNYFALEARDTGDDGPATCLTYDTPTCVGFYALNRLPIRVQPDGDVANFFLANIEPVHEGKILEVEMWDLGEKMENVQFLDPSGVPQPFTWVTDDTRNIANIGAPGVAHPAEDCSGSPCLYVNLGGTTVEAKNDEWNDFWRFNGRLVTARIELTTIPEGLDNYWWSIRYEKTAANTNDWTTWSTRVVGDPVRLIE